MSNLVSLEGSLWDLYRFQKTDTDWQIDIVKSTANLKYKSLDRFSIFIVFRCFHELFSSSPISLSKKDRLTERQTDIASHYVAQFTPISFIDKTYTILNSNLIPGVKIYFISTKSRHLSAKSAFFMSFLIALIKYT